MAAAGGHRHLPLLVCAGLLLAVAAAGAAEPRATTRATQTRRSAPRTETAASRPSSARLEQDSPQAQQAAIEAETKFARQAMQKLGIRLSEVETAHFRIWTTLSPEHHQVLAGQCEAMYAALQRIFRVPADESVFLGKCGVYILGNQEQFKTFCRVTEEIPPENLESFIGYHVGMPDGRVRILAFWPGNTQQLAEVLVHEGSHAFLYRYRRTGRVDRWFNEGLAEHVVGLVFRMQAEQGRGAIQRAAEFARNDPQLLSRIVDANGSLPGPYYCVAQSAVAFLVQANPRAFAELVRALKDGTPFAQALQQTYSATLADYDTHWRRWLLQAAQAGRPLY